MACQLNQALCWIEPSDIHSLELAMAVSWHSPKRWGVSKNRLTFHTLWRY
jgi:hypothetical protein